MILFFYSTFAPPNRNKLIIKYLVLILIGFVVSENENFTTPKIKEEKTTTTSKTTCSTEDTNILFLQKDFIGFKEALAFKESQGKYFIVNKLGHLGKYQFGKTTLQRFNIHDTQAFLRNPELQERAFIALCKVNKYILRKDIKRSVGKTINGIKITESGIIAAAHLGGAGNVKRYLRSNGTRKFSDAFGTSIKSYMKKFSNYDISYIIADKKAKV